MTQLILAIAINYLVCALCLIEIEIKVEDHCFGYYKWIPVVNTLLCLLFFFALIFSLFKKSK